MNEYDYHIGAEIHCTDRQWGQLAKVALESRTKQVTHLIVQTGLLLKEAHVIPVEVVTSATDKAIQLAITTRELQQYPLYKEKQFEVPVENGPHGNYSYSDSALNPQGHTVVAHVPMQKVTIREGVDQTLELMEKGTPVKNVNGEIGKLDHVITDADSNEITHLVMRHGFFFPEHLVVPISVITEIGEEGIFVEVTDDELKKLMSYSSDDINVPGNDIEPLPVLEREADKGLTTDGIVSDRVANALRTHPMTADAVIEVIPQGGLVTLIGVVNDEKTRQTAEQVASSQDNVIKVVNELEVRTPEYRR